MENPHDAQGNMSLGKQVLRGGALSYGSFLVSKVLVFLSTLILTRILAPRDFGLVGYALLVISFLDVLKSLGVTSALIYRQDIKDEDAGETLVLSVITGCIFFVICWLVAPLAAAFFHDWRVAELTRVLGFGFVIFAFGSVHSVLLQRQMRFGRRFLPDALLSLAKGVVSVWLAMVGLGYWSLVWGQLAGIAVATLANWCLLPILPRLRFRWASARRLLSYGMQLTLVDLLGTIVGNADYVIIGRTLGSGPLGLYILAFTIPQMVTISLAVAVSRVAFPAYAAIQHDAEALRHGYLTVLRYSALALVPIGLGFCMAAAPFVHALYRPVWWPAIPAMQALALFSLINALGWHAGDIYKATGRPDIQWKLSIGQAVVLVPILIAGARLDGIAGVAIAQVVAVVPYSLVRFWLIRRILGIGSTEIVSALRVPLLAGAALFGVCLSVGQLPIAQTSPALVLALQALAGGAVYGAVVLALDPSIRRAVRLPRSGRGGMGQPELATDVARAAQSHHRDSAERAEYRRRRVSNAEQLERLELDDGW
jgi:lipopolysaccharide exporter